MFIKTGTLIGAMAALEAVSASAVAKRQVLKDQDVGSRIPDGAKIGDQCHPAGNYALGDGKPIPPCLSEQAIAAKCEIVTQAMKEPSEEKWKAYRDCLAGEGSSYFQEVQGCIACKAAHNHMSKEQADWFSQRWVEAQKAFADDATPCSLVWEYVQDAIGQSECRDRKGSGALRGWDCWNQLPAGTGVATNNQTVEQYYANRPKSQNIGRFTLNGKQYPETGSVELGLMAPVFEVKAHLGVYTGAKLEAGKLSLNVSSFANVEILTQYHEIKSVCNFTKPDEFTIVPLISAPIPVKNTVVTVPKEQANSLPEAKCDASCRSDAPTIEKIQQVAAESPKEAPKAVIEAARPAMKDLENNKPISSKSQAQLVAKAEMLIEIPVPATFKVEGKPAPQLKTQPTPESGNASPSENKVSAPENKASSPENKASSPERASPSENKASPQVGKDSNQAGKPSLTETQSGSTHGATNVCVDGATTAAGSSVKVTVCQMPGETNCKVYYY